MPDFLVVKIIRPPASPITEAALLSLLPPELAASAAGVWIYDSNRLAVVQAANAAKFADQSFAATGTDQVRQSIERFFKHLFFSQVHIITAY
jgi:hypothetical protein